MNIRKPGIIALLTVTASILGLAALANSAPMTPELAAKKEMVRKQQAQRITHEKRLAAADALKAERRRIYNAKQTVKQNPGNHPGNSNK
jgi:hypothetical protein